MYESMSGSKIGLISSKLLISKSIIGCLIKRKLEIRLAISATEEKNNVTFFWDQTTRYGNLWYPMSYTGSLNILQTGP